MRVIVGAVIAGAVVTLASPSVLLAASQSSGGSGKLTLSGRVGPLQLDRSTVGRVIAYAGRPAATGRGNFGASEPDYYAMGYSCQENAQGWMFQVGQYAHCRTVFFINTYTNRLAAFYSLSRKYSFRGARTGMSTATAQRHVHTHAVDGCGEGFFLSSQAASFLGEESGGRGYEHHHHYWLRGGHLRALGLESRRYPVGLGFC